MNQSLLGGLLWAALFYPLWSPRLRRFRAGAQVDNVSRNQTGPAWVQDEPYNECFEEDDL